LLLNVPISWLLPPRYYILSISEFLVCSTEQMSMLVEWLKQRSISTHLPMDRRLSDSIKFKGTMPFWSSVCPAWFSLDLALIKQLSFAFTHMTGCYLLDVIYFISLRVVLLLRIGTK
jgi:hypothetical protein